MNENGGTSTFDQVNGLKWTLSAQAAWVSGLFGSGLFLGAVNGTQITADIQGASLASDKPWTVIFVMKPHPGLAACKMYSKGSGANPSWDFDVESALGQDFCLTYNGPGGSTKWGTGSNFWPTLNRYEKWNVFFWVNRPDGSGATGVNTLKFYVNGSSFPISVTDPTGGNTVTFVANNAVLSLGNFSDGSAAQKCGFDFDEVSIYQVDLTRGSDSGAKALFKIITGPSASKPTLP